MFNGEKEQEHKKYVSHPFYDEIFAFWITLLVPLACPLPDRSCGLISVTPYFMLSAVESSPPFSPMKEVFWASSAEQPFKLIFQGSLHPVLLQTRCCLYEVSPIHKPNQILRPFVGYYVMLSQQSKLYHVKNVKTVD